MGNKIIEVLMSALLLLPVFGVLHKVRFHSTGKTARYFLFAVYLAAVYLFVGMPTVQFMRFDLSLTLVPFMPMLKDLKNTILNVALFVPLGMLLPFLWNRYCKGKTVVLFGFGMSVAIELLQILTYRATDINDVIANTVGALLGWCLFCGAACAFPGLRRYAGSRTEVAAVLLPVMAVMFFLQPYLATLFYQLT